MIGVDLQTLNIAPRAGTDPRIPKTDDSHLATGKDGKLYKMEDRRNWGKYHTLSEEELQEEYRRSEEVRTNMLTMTGQLKNGKIVKKPNKSTVTVTSPQFGVTTQSRRIEQRAWEKELQTANSTGRTLNQSRFGGTVSKLLANTKPEDLDEEEQPENESAEVYDYDDVQEAGTIEQKALNVIQKKYEQNLTVVEKLFHEKLSLEEYTKTLERQLEQLTGKKIEHSPFQSLNNSFDEAIAHGDESVPVYQEIGPKISKYDPTALVSSAELAELLSKVDNGTDRGRSRSRGIPPSASVDTHPIKQRSHSAPRSGNYSTPRKAMSYDDPDYVQKITRSRSSERSISSRKVDGPSPHLQADIDRYVQKRKLMEERERLIKREQLEYERSLHEKQTQASLKGEEFLAMRMREEETRKKVEARLKKLEEDEKKAIIEKKWKEQDDRKKKLEKLKQELQSRSNMTWEEIQQEEERNRQERREKRKNELLLMSSLPKSIEENLRKTVAKTSPSKHQIIQHQHFKAEDIEKVREKLRKSLEKKEQMEQKQRERTRDRSEERRLSGGGSSGRLSGGGSGVAGELSARELREKERKERWTAFKQQQQEKENQKRVEEKLKEKLKHERLLSAKLPDSALKLTKAEALKQKKMQETKLQDEKRRQMEAKKYADKQLSLKETAAMVSLVLKERQEKLKMKNPGYTELTSVDKLVSDRAKQAKDDYDRKLIENQRKYNEVKRNRPSLIMREDEKNAKKKAKQQAGAKVANAILGSGRGGDDDDKNGHASDSDDDSIFGKKDKSKTASRNSSRSYSINNVILDEVLDPTEQLIAGIK